MTTEKELEDEIKQLMLFCRHNKEAKDRLNKICYLIKQARQDEREKELIEDVEELINKFTFKADNGFVYADPVVILEELNKLKIRP